MIEAMHCYHSLVVPRTLLTCIDEYFDSYTGKGGPQSFTVCLVQLEGHYGNLMPALNSGNCLSRASGLLAATAGVFTARRWGFSPVDPEELRYPATILVRVRWFLLVAGVLLLVYRSEFTYVQYTIFIPITITAVALTMYLHYHIRSDRIVTLQGMLTLSAIEFASVTAGLVFAGGFRHAYIHLFYYPVLAWFAVFFNSFRLSFAWVTMVAVTYATLSLTVGADLDFAARDEKTLFTRIVVMYAVVATVNLVSRSERIRRQHAVARERELQQERINLSQTIHDTTAQSAYLIGLGIETAIELADESNRPLVAKLEATYALSKSAMWELRHPIDIGLIFEGRALSSVLQAHAATFTTITSVPAAVVQTGKEPSLSLLTRSGLFSIAHNALTNALRHARASQVTIELDFQASGVRMSVVDDGIGLPADYAARGQGFKNMRTASARLGGRLDVESSRSGGGTTVTCVLEHNPA